jgi:hypothetical protein
MGVMDGIRFVHNELFQYIMDIDNIVYHNV